jgi:glycosyltransferase domain-containing protein
MKDYMSLTSKCAIIIPTMNKSLFIEQKLLYFSHINYKGTIYIADSSNEYHFNYIADRINFYNIQGLKVKLFNTRGLNIEQSKHFVIKFVKEPYSQYCGDDDYILMNGLTKGITFLEKNHNYATYTAKAVQVNLSEWNQNKIVRYDLFGSESALKSKRLINYSRKYWPIWVLHRTRNYSTLLEQTILYKTPHFREIFMGLKSLSQGMCKKGNEAYLIRGIHENRFVFENLNVLKNSPEFIQDKHEIIKFLVKEFANDFNKDALIDEIIMNFTSVETPINESRKTYLSKILRIYKNKGISFLLKWKFVRNRDYEMAKFLFSIK